MTTTARGIIASAANFTERWILSVIFLCLAAREFTKIWGIVAWNYRSDIPKAVDLSNHAILFLLGIFTAVLLLAGRRPVVPPERLKFIVIPLVTTFYTILYYTVPDFPAALRSNLCPAALQRAMLVIAWACIIVGPAISLWGLLYLGRSFGVYVTVRKVVLGGPYRWIRHPMYLGWVFICLGVALSNFSIAYFLLTGIHIALLVYRAHLEETQLAAHSPEYRANMGRTGFILPRFGATERPL